MVNVSTAYLNIFNLLFDLSCKMKVVSPGRMLLQSVLFEIGSAQHVQKNTKRHFSTH